MTESKASGAPIVVVGAGLAGCMAAAMLGKKGLPVLLVEQRDDWRIQDQKDTELGRLANSQKRSINLALSYRGISAMKHIGLFEAIEPILIPMRGRYMHSQSGGPLTFQPYGTGDQAIYSVSRGTLNQLLLAECDKVKNVEVSFGEKLMNVEKNGNCTLAKRDGSQRTVRSRLVIGADGAYSRVRSALVHHARMDYSLSHIKTAYKELTIMPTKEGQFAMKDSDGLHIWPRGEFMMIALPNPDKSFTCTVFAPAEGPESFTELESADQITGYFKKWFPDVLPMIPDLVEQFQSNPSAALVTIRCKPWNYKGNIVLLGDAAHAAVPFYGQGANAAFEDCLVLSELWDEFKGDQNKIIPRFSELRQPACDALADLSLEHYREMRALTASKVWLAKKRLEGVLHAIAPSVWVPEYTLVAFTRTPYHEARKRAAKQDKILYRALLGLGAAAVGVGAYVFARKRKLL